MTLLEFLQHALEARAVWCYRQFDELWFILDGKAKIAHELPGGGLIVASEGEK